VLGGSETFLLVSSPFALATTVGKRITLLGHTFRDVSVPPSPVFSFSPVYPLERDFHRVKVVDENLHTLVRIHIPAGIDIDRYTAFLWERVERNM
jgi:hypothetical protein